METVAMQGSLSLQWVFASTSKFQLATPLEEPIPKGHMMVIEFITDSDADNDGKGFRLSWECADYKTPQL